MFQSSRNTGAQSSGIVSFYGDVQKNCKIYSSMLILQKN